MKKFLTVTLLVLSMMIFVSCGDSDDETDTGDTVSDSDSDTGDSAADEEKTDTGDQTNDEENNTPGLPNDDDEATDTGDSADDNESTDTDDPDSDDNTDTGDDNVVIDDSTCETVVYKSMDVRKMDVNEIDIWLYDSETYVDDTPPLFFIEAYFTKNVTELKGETISLQNLDPNDENGPLVFFYTDFDASMWWFKKNYIAKSGSFHIEDVDADDYTKLKIKTTAILFYELAIDEENGIYNEVENGKCYKLEPFEWNTID